MDINEIVINMDDTSLYIEVENPHLCGNIMNSNIEKTELAGKNSVPVKLKQFFTRKITSFRFLYFDNHLKS